MAGISWHNYVFFWHMWYFVEAVVENNCWVITTTSTFDKLVVRWCEQLAGSCWPSGNYLWRVDNGTEENAMDS
jgi:hypothetical protein